MRIAVTGATGFIGQRFIDLMASDPQIELLALSRGGYDVGPAKGRKVDFFNLKQAEQALADCDVAIYLLHSMSPSNRLAQGHFADFDFILADNFARAARKNKLKQIIYVGGIVDDRKTDLSPHLHSRLEVEKTLGAYEVPVTALRCSLVIGERGSSFIILKKLVYRLPSMGLPAWVRTPCQPIFLDDLAQIMKKCLLHPQALARVFDCGAPECLTYRDLIVLTAEAAGLKRRLLDLPRIPLGLSKLWVRLVTGASRSLVYPLIDSLESPMLVCPDRQLPPELRPRYTAIKDAIALAIRQKLPERRPISGRPSAQVKERNEVKSVQRLTLPHGFDAWRVARCYMKWLPRYLTGLLYVTTAQEKTRFYLRIWPQPFLELSLADNRSDTSRQLFYITGGLLASQPQKGRLEFRESPQRDFVFAAIHDYTPALPWWIYRMSQAWFHLLIMWAFAQFLHKVNSRSLLREAALTQREVSS